MIKRISGKRSDPSGQLEVIKNRNIPIELNSPKNPNLSLAWNQLNDINHVIDFARHNLVFSSEEMSRNFTNKYMNTDDTDTSEAISSFFLSNSILLYNSSFDYLWILLRILYSSHEDLISDFPINTIEDEMKRQKIQKDDWEKVLFKNISIIRCKDRKKWINKNKEISDMMKENIKQINNINKTLRSKYQANNLKHGEFPYFKRSNPQNAFGGKLKLSMEQFYLKSGKQRISFGIPQTGLSIDDAQEFLIDYNNRTVNLVDLIIEDKFLLKNNFLEMSDK